MIEYYQNLGMPGDEAKEHKNRKHSRYWNEGKWKHFIEPLLPKDCKDMTFVDIGCNAGLFLKLAKDRGFRDVIGVEKSRRAYQRAIKYRKYLGYYNYKLLHRTVGVDFTFDELPLADIVLLSNVHYYFPLIEWFKFLDRLRHRTCACLIISRPTNEKAHWRPRTSIAEVKYYFREWKAAGAVYRARAGWRDRNDRSPRVLWSFLFKSNLNRKKFSELYPGAPARAIKIPKKELYRKLNKESNVDLRKTSYFQAWEKRKEMGGEEIYKFVKEKADLMKDIKENGIKDPVLINLYGKIVDGGHRIAILKELGYKSVIARAI